MQILETIRNKKSKQKATEKSVAQENRVECFIDLQLTSIFSSLLRDNRNVTVRNPISPPNLIVDSSSLLNAQVLEEETGLFTSQDKEFTSQNKE